MEKEKEDFVKKQEEAIKKDDALKEKTAKEIEADMKKKGLFLNPGQKFSQDGMLESTVKKGNIILTKIQSVLVEELPILPEVTRRIMSQCEPNEKNPARPVVSFVGEEIVVKITVPPTDKYGNWGKKWLTKEEKEKFEGKKDDA